MNFKIYFTSDTHGFVFPTNFLAKEPIAMGLLSCISHFHKDGNTLVIDGGDTVQGSPFSKFMWQNSAEDCLISKVLNHGEYDFVTMGNHDFNYDYCGVKSFLSSLNAQCLLANVKDKTGELPIVPHTIKTLENGLKIGLVGIVTDYVKLWENPEHLENFDISDPFEAAKKSLETLKGQCDFTVCIYHGGFECDIATGQSQAKGTENVGYKICRELDFDLLLTGHQHMPLEGQTLFGTHTLQLPPNGQKFAKIEVSIEGDSKKITSQQIAPTLEYDKQFANTLEETRQAVERWLDQPVGEFSEEIPAHSKLELGINGSRLADFCNQLQLEYTGADISTTSLGNNPIGFPKKVTVRHILGAYQFPNTIVVMEVDKATIVSCLERCAEYLTLNNGEIEISKCFVSPKVEHYNYDFFAGVGYSFDLTKPVGQRVCNLTFNGKPLDENKSYIMCMNNYRATGTGGYEALQSCKVIKEYGVDIQELIIDYISKKGFVEIMDKPKFTILV